MEANALQERIRHAYQRASEYPPEVQSLVEIMLAEDALMGDRRRSGFKHETYHDLILQHGTVRSVPLELPEWCPIMEPQQCYLNSYLLVTENPGLIYCEGYALHSYFPVAHAWVEDEDGRIIDPTWSGLSDEPKNAAYAGLKFDRDFLTARADETGWVSIFVDDWLRDAEILRCGFVFDDDGVAIGMGEL